VLRRGRKKQEAGSRIKSFRFSAFGLLFLILCFLLLSACAKREPKTAITMSSDLRSFHALAYVVAEKGDIKWASNVTISIRSPDSLRIDALERLSDVVATINAKGPDGYLELPLTGKKVPFNEGNIILPLVGNVSLDPMTFSNLLIGRPYLEKGGAQVSKEFHSSGGSYFLRGPVDEMEVETDTANPLVYTRFTGPDKKRVMLEADFDDFVKIGNKRFPRHVVIMFENPKLLMEIKYKEIKAE